MSAHQAGQIQVMSQLLDEAAGIIANIEPESSDEARRLAMWLDAAGRAVRATQFHGVDIDNECFRLTGG